MGTLSQRTFFINQTREALGTGFYCNTNHSLFHEIRPITPKSDWYYRHPLCIPYVILNLFKSRGNIFCSAVGIMFSTTEWMHKRNHALKRKDPAEYANDE